MIESISLFLIPFLGWLLAIWLEAYTMRNLFELDREYWWAHHNSFLQEPYELHNVQSVEKR